MKRDLLFLLADNTMKEVFRRFLTRDGAHLSLGIQPFGFDPDEDLRTFATQTDPGLYTRAHELLRPFKGTHERAVVVLDNDWEGSPGPEAIRDHISANLIREGWDVGSFCVIVITPELEAWIWQDHIHVETAFRYRREQNGGRSLCEVIKAAGLWPEEAPKPPRPKETVEWVKRRYRRGATSVIFGEIASVITTKHCLDEAFAELHTNLQAWFGY